MPKKVVTDGRSYFFTPGKNGSLISAEATPPAGLALTDKAVARTLISPDAKNSAERFEKRKKREGIVRTLSIRG